MLFGHQSFSGYFGKETFLHSSREGYKSSVDVVTGLGAERSRNRGSIFDGSKETSPFLPDLELTKLPIMGYRTKLTTAI